MDLRWKDIMVSIIAKVFVLLLDGTNRDIVSTQAVLLRMFPYIENSDII